MPDGLLNPLSLEDIRDLFTYLASSPSAERLLRPVQSAGLFGAAYIGVFEMGIAYVFWLKAMKLSTDTARIANLIFICPFLSLIFIHFLLGEQILPATFIGLIFIVAGLVLQGRSGRDRGGERS